MLRSTKSEKVVFIIELWYWTSWLSIANSINSSFLPGGEEESEETGLYEEVEPSSMMLHCLLAVMYASSRDSQEAVRDASVMGFVYVAEVDEKKRRLKILAPLNTRITDRPMIWGSWPETTVSLIWITSCTNQKQFDFQSMSFLSGWQNWCWNHVQWWVLVVIL